MTKRLWVFSIDALGDCDAPLFETLPGFARVIREGSYLPHMRGVYPTLTYPSHVSIITGRSPGSHGIVNNRRFEPDRVNPEWFWFERDIRGDSLMRAGKRAGKRIAAFLWPVNAGAKIRSNFAEIMPTRPWHKQLFRSLANSTLSTILPMERRFGRLRSGIAQPQLDDFTEACTGYLIERVRADMMFIHFLDVDTNKHAHGVNSSEVQAAIRRIDGRIQRIFEWRDRQPDRDEIDMVFLSDHSQIDTPEMIFPLDDFERMGLLQRSGDAVGEFTACPFSAGGACYIYTAKPDKGAGLRERLEDYAERTRGIECIYFGPEIAEMGADPEAFCMMEAERGYMFSEFFEGTPQQRYEQAHHAANHGFHPDKADFNAIFMATGPSFRRGVRLEARHSLLDIAPTLSHVTGLALQGCEHPPVTDILNR